MAGQLEEVARGIQAFARGEEQAPAARRPVMDTYTEVKLEDIDPDPDQPRKDLGDLEELKASISQVGVIQPIIISPVEETRRFRLLAGERRFAAAKALGMRTIKAIVRSIEEQERLYVQVIENIQRKDLNALEEAESYRRLMEEFGLRQEEVAEKVGKSQPAISQTLRVLDLPEEIKAEYKHAYTVPKTLLLEVVRQPSPERQRALWERVKTGELSIVQARRERKGKTQGQEEAPRSPTRFSFATKDNSVFGAITFRDGSADKRELLRVLQAWAHEVGREITAEQQEEAPAPGDRMETEKEPGTSPEGLLVASGAERKRVL